MPLLVVILVAIVAWLYIKSRATGASSVDTSSAALYGSNAGMIYATGASDPTTLANFYSAQAAYLDNPDIPQPIKSPRAN